MFFLLYPWLGASMLKSGKTWPLRCPYLPTYLPTYLPFLPYVRETKKEIIGGVKVGYYTN